MRYVELLEAIAPSSYLYHGTDTDSAAKILHQNIILDNTEHNDSKLISHKGRRKTIPLPVGNKDITKHRYVKGVSTSRSPEFPKIWRDFIHGGVIFVLDRAKVNADNRIIPVSYYENIGSFRDEMEDFVVGSIRNLDRKLAQVMVSQATYDWMISEDEMMMPGYENYDDIINHPLLKII